MLREKLMVYEINIYDQYQNTKFKEHMSHDTLSLPEVTGNELSSGLSVVLCKCYLFPDEIFFHQCLLATSLAKLLQLLLSKDKIILCVCVYSIHINI